jgi:hypothetical protein
MFIDHLACRTNMPIIRRTDPVVVERIFQLAFNPGAAIADASTGAFVISRRAPKFNGPQALWVTDVAKNKFSYTHEISRYKQGWINYLWLKFFFLINFDYY